MKAVRWAGLQFHPTFCAFFPQTAFTMLGHAVVDLRIRAAREVCDRSAADSIGDPV